MKLHVLGLPHTETTREYLHCAYTQKVLKFCDMMSAGGYEVILYSGSENEAVCAEHVTLISREERVGWFGEWDTNNLFEGINWDPASPWWAAMNGRAVIEVGRRAEPHDVLCLVTATQSPVAAALPKLMPVEWAVGYEGIQLHKYPSGTPPSRVFESYAWMHHMYGKWGIGANVHADGGVFDAVIPNFFDPADFARPVVAKPDDYMLFIGRLVWRKGLQAAAAIADRLDMPLVVAGPGARNVEPGQITLIDGVVTGRTLKYFGPADVEARAELMAHAAVTIVPTFYVEPFGGVAVEAMMAGCPVVASDWGAFTETVQQGVSGHRFRTLAEGCTAVVEAGTLDRAKVREYALSRYSLEAVYPMFDQHFKRLAQLWDAGWYA